MTFRFSRQLDEPGVRIIGDVNGVDLHDTFLTVDEAADFFLWLLTAWRND